MLKFCANITMLYRELPLVERFAAARADGFRAVEILSPEDASMQSLQDAATRACVDVALCNAPMGDFLDGGPGMSAVRGRQSEFHQAIEQARQMAVALQCPTVHIGPARIPSGRSKTECLEVLMVNLKYTAQLFENNGIIATIEPMNTHDFPDVCLSQVSDAIGILEEVAEDNIALQFDIYHMARMEENLPALIERNIDRIGHIQFADVPGRHEPGSGELDFDALFEMLEKLQYSGYLGAEYMPQKSTVESLTWFESFRAAQ